jgi:hypothetical protein
MLFIVVALIFGVFAAIGAATGTIGTSQSVDNHVTWIAFISLGIIFPGAAVAIASSGSKGRTTRLLLAAVGAVVTCFAIISLLEQAAIGFAILTVVLTVLPLGPERYKVDDHRMVYATTVFLIITAGWLSAAPMSYFAVLHEWLLGKGQPDPVFATTVYVVAIGLVFAAVCIPSRTKNLRAVRAVDASALLLFALLCLRRDAMLPDTIHPSFFIGPAEMVRQGGWLLWDVPSQYGFANILAIALMPVKDSYAAEYVLDALLVFVVAGLVYFLLRLSMSSIGGALGAAAITIGSVFILGGLYYVGIGEQHYPSVGPLRFIWCFVLLAVIARWYVSRPSKETTKRTLIALAVMWPFAVLWSVESALYSTCCLSLAFPSIASLEYSRRQVIRWCALPAILLVTALLAIQLFYVVGLGHGPDWFAFAEYGFAYRGGFGSVPYNMRGAGTSLLFTFAILSTASLLVIAEKRRRALPLVLASCAIQWATASYFIGRSVDNNVLNLMAINVTTLAATLVVVTREPFEPATKSMLRLAAIPILAMTVGLSFSGQSALAYQLTTYRPSALGNHLYDGYPAVPPEALPVLQAAKLEPGDPILWANEFLAPTWAAGSPIPPHVWTPAYPPILFSVLSLERQQTYVNRFIDRRPQNGYLMVDRLNAPHDPGLMTALATRYDSPVAASNQRYVLLHYILRRR